MAEQLPNDEIRHWTDRMMKHCSKDGELFHLFYTIQLQHQQIVLLKQLNAGLENKAKTMESLKMETALSAVQVFDCVKSDFPDGFRMRTKDNPYWEAIRNCITKNNQTS
jgi:hypothetical protein